MTAPERSAVAYARVSSAEQLREGFSIPAQWQILHDYAERNAMRIVAEFSDDETAKVVGRGGFSRMVSHLREHSDHALIVEKTDRLYRNIRDYLTIDELGVEIHFAKEGGKDRRDSDARFMHLLRVGMARKYVENLSEEVRKGMKRKCEEGGWPTWAPLGYRNEKAPDGRRVLVVDPVKAPLVVELFEAAASGNCGYGDLVRMAESMGLIGRNGGALGKPSLVHIMSNVAYTGEFTWSGITYRGKYEPLIPRELYDAAQSALRTRGRTSFARRTFTFSGLVSCDTCGGALTGDRKKGRYVYYFCGGKRDCKRYYRESLFEAEAVAVLRSLAVDEAVSGWVIAEMGRWYDATAGKDLDGVARARARLTQLRTLQTTSYEEKLLGKVDEETWRTLNEKWRADASRVESEIAIAQPQMTRAEFLAAVARPFELAQVAADLYLRRTDEEKAQLLKIITSNFRVVDGKVYVSMRSPFDILLESRDRTDWLGRVDDLRTRLDVYGEAIIKLAA